MKINLKKCALVLALTIGAFIGVQNVHAATLTMEDSGYFYDRNNASGNDRHSWYWRLYTVDGQVAYRLIIIVYIILSQVLQRGLQ